MKGDVVALQQANSNKWNRSGTRGSYTNGYGANNMVREMECNQSYYFTAGGGFTPGEAVADAPPVNDEPAGATTLTSSLTVPTDVCGQVYTSRSASQTDLTGFYNGKATPNGGVRSATPDDDVRMDTLEALATNLNQTSSSGVALLTPPFGVAFPL